MSEENVQIEKMDDTKVRVDGHEIQPMESFKVNFEELEKESEEEISEDEEDSEDDETYELNDSDEVMGNGN